MARFTRSNVIGTLPYMAPEQLLGAPPDPVHDIYAIGVVLYEAITGSPPFMRGDIQYQILKTPPRPLRLDNPPLENLIFACLEKNPDHRPESAKELAINLARALKREDIVGETGLPARTASREPNPFPRDKKS